MAHRQSIPGQWLIVTQDLDRQAIQELGRLPRGAGVLLLHPPKAAIARKLRKLAVARRLTMISEGRSRAARVHDMRELTRAKLERTPLILISPIYPTRSHPDWKPLPRMRAAALARLSDRQAIALGGMDEMRFRRIEPLGFVAWAGITAWRKVNTVTDL
jgi:thiamine-phosphate pyrophosphorylase